MNEYSKVENAMKSTGFGIIAALAVMCTAQAKQATDDQAFVTQAAQGGMAEVALGHVANTQGNSDVVKQFGKQMATDHAKAGASLVSAAGADGLTLPPSASPKQQATEAKMKALQGAKFDKAYADAMVKDHRDTIALFEREAKSGSSAHVKAFAQETLPTLNEHLKMAEDLKSGLK
jgi:putative membrane protein